MVQYYDNQFDLKIFFCKFLLDIFRCQGFRFQIIVEQFSTLDFSIPNRHSAELKNELRAQLKSVKSWKQRCLELNVPRTSVRNDLRMFDFNFLGVQYTIVQTPLVLNLFVKSLRYRHISGLKNRRFLSFRGNLLSLKTFCLLIFFQKVFSKTFLGRLSNNKMAGCHRHLLHPPVFR